MSDPVSFSYVAGDDILLEFTVARDGVAVSISGMEPRFTVRRRAGDPAVISTEEDPATATATITDAVNGVFQVAVTGEVTQGLRNTYAFQAEIEDGADRKQTVAHGFLTFKADIIPG